MQAGQDNQQQAARIASAIRDARARILWGDPVATVLDSMMEAGVDGAFAQTVVKEAMKERGAEIRASGIKEILVGGVVLVVGTVAFLTVFLSGMISMVLVGGSMTFALYGAFRILRGITRLIAGPRAAIDVSDL